MTALSTCRSSMPCCAALAVALALSPTTTRAADLLDLDGGAAPATAGRSVAGAPSLGPSVGGFGGGALVGLDIPPSGYTLGVRLSGELMFGLVDLAPQLRLDLGGRVALHFGGLDNPLNIPDVSTSAFALDVVPDLRILYALAEPIAVYGDFGLGFAYLRNSASRGAASISSDTASLALQFGFGAAYAVTRNINLLGEVRFNVYTASGSGTFIAFPQVGVQFH